jgi:peptide/nickel transport system substrate-binding protein
MEDVQTMATDGSSWSSIDRRRFLKTTGAGALVMSVAGCQGDGGDTTTGEGDTTTAGEGVDEDEDTPTETETETTIQEEKEVPRGGTITFGVSNTPKGLNPLAVSSAYSWILLDFVYAGGTYIEPVNFEVKPWAYSDWTVENVESGKPDVYFDVRDDLTFTDGEDLTVEDVLFSYRYMMEQKPARYLSSVEPIEKVEEAGNDWDVHMKLTKRIGTYASNQLAIPLLPKHIWSEVDDYQKYQPGQQVPDRPVGSGFGDITKYQADTSAEIEFQDTPLTNQQWVKDHPRLRAGGPFLDGVRYKFFTEQSPLTQAFLQGGVDTTYGSIPSSKVPDVKGASGRELVPGSDTGYGYFGYNLRRVPFDDLSFRQALSFLWDDTLWINRLNRGLAFEGDFAIPPGYAAVRPDLANDVDDLKDPRSQAFHFRQTAPGVANINGVREFLKNGEMITGEGGTYVGKEYPGSFTGVTASQSEPRHEYTFGPVKSSVLKNADTDKEIRVDGKTLTEIHGRPVRYLMYPPQVVPELTEMDQEWATQMKKLGIPVKTEVLSFNSLLDVVYAKEDFDLYHMGWTSTSPFGVSSLYGIFHSDNADDHADGNDSAMLNNSIGYGLFDYATADELISNARTEMETEKRNELIQRAAERIYLDQAYMVFDYSKIRWPVNTDEYAGFIQNIPSPGGTYFPTQTMFGIYRKQG